MKLIGFKRNDFTTREGVTITGYNLYLTYPATGPEAQGMVAEHIYMTDAKLAKCGLDAGKFKVGSEVTVQYNRFDTRSPFLFRSKDAAKKDGPRPPVRGVREAVLT